MARKKSYASVKQTDISTKLASMKKIPPTPVEDNIPAEKA